MWTFTLRRIDPTSVDTVTVFTTVPDLPSRFMLPEISPPLPGGMTQGVSGRRATVQPQLVLVPVMVTALVQTLVSVNLKSTDCSPSLAWISRVCVSQASACGYWIFEAAGAVSPGAGNARWKALMSRPPEREGACADSTPHIKAISDPIPHRHHPELMRKAISDRSRRASLF